MQEFSDLVFIVEINVVDLFERGRGLPWLLVAAEDRQGQKEHGSKREQGKSAENIPTRCHAFLECRRCHDVFLAFLQQV